MTQPLPLPRIVLLVVANLDNEVAAHIHQQMQKAAATLQTESDSSFDIDVMPIRLGLRVTIRAPTPPQAEELAGKIRKFLGKYGMVERQISKAVHNLSLIHI